MRPADRFARASSLPGIDPDLPIVIFMNRVTNSTCPVIDVAKGLRAAVGYSMAKYQSSLVLPHEMGHVLGLDDARCAGPDLGHLMCEEDIMQKEKIRPQDCAKARQAAAVLVKRKWGVVVIP